MKRLLLLCAALSLALMFAGLASGAGVTVDQLVVQIEDTDPDLASNILSTLAGYSPEVEMQFIVTEADPAAVFALRQTINADPGDTTAQLTFGTGGGTLYMAELDELPGGLNLIVTNPDVSELEELLTVINPTSVLVQFIIIDPDPEEVELLMAPQAPDVLGFHVLLFNPSAFQGILSALLSGASPENIRFTTTFAAD